MPTVFIVFGFRFVFYSNDHSPIHIHVIKGSIKAKFSLFPVELIENKGLSIRELRMVKKIIEENQEIIAKYWNEYFNRI